MHDLSTTTGIGTQLRHVLEILDDEVADTYRYLGLPEYRPRFSPFVKALVTSGPMSIRELAEAIEVTHSAASQTVAQMERSGFVALRPGNDARQRIVRLTPKAEAMIPIIEAEWRATSRAMADLDAELAVPIAEMLRNILTRLEERSLGQRMLETGLLSTPAFREGDVIDTNLLANPDH